MEETHGKKNITYLLLFGDLPHAAAAPAAGERGRAGAEKTKNPQERHPGKDTGRRRVSPDRGKVCDKTPWESKCLVRALAAQRLLCRRGLSSTLYLGCGMEEGKMVAHAWLRFGEMYVTGGDGGGYTTVAGSVRRLPERGDKYVGNLGNCGSECGAVRGTKKKSCREPVGRGSADAAGL